MTIVERLTDASEESVREVLRQAEACLSGTVQLAMASDQRAATLAGIFTAVGVAIAGASTALAATGPFFLGALVASVLMFAAAASFIYSARPVDFHVSGYEPEQLSKSAADPRWVMIYAISDTQERIRLNREVLRQAAWPYYLGAGLAIVAVPVGAAACYVFAALSLPS